MQGRRDLAEIEAIDRPPESLDHVAAIRIPDIGPMRRVHMCNETLQGSPGTGTVRRRQGMRIARMDVGCSGK